MSLTDLFNLPLEENPKFANPDQFVGEGFGANIPNPSFGGLQEGFQPPPIPEGTAPQLETQEDMFNYLFPEKANPVNPEQEAKALNTRQGIGQLARALVDINRLSGANNGAYIQKKSSDLVTPQIQKELERMRLMYQQDERKTRDFNIANEIRKAQDQQGFNMWSKGQQNAMDRTKMQIEGYENRQKSDQSFKSEQDAKYKVDQTDEAAVAKQYEQKLAFETAVDDHRTANKMGVISAQARKELDILGFGGGYSRAEIDAIYNGEGSFKEGLKYAGKDAGKVDVNAEYETAMAEFKKMYPKDSKAREAFIASLPFDQQFIFNGTKTPTANEAKAIIAKLKQKQKEQNAISDAITPPEGDSTKPNKPLSAMEEYLLNQK